MDWKAVQAVAVRSSRPSSPSKIIGSTAHSIWKRIEPPKPDRAVLRPLKVPRAKAKRAWSVIDTVMVCGVRRAREDACYSPCMP